MTTVRSRRQRSAQPLHRSLGTAIFVASPLAVCGAAAADPALPTIGSTVYNVTFANPSIDSGATASTGGTAAANAAVINAFISYASANGGGTVEIPGSGTFVSNQITLNSNVNLQIDTGATLQNGTPTSTFITTSGTTHDIEISGGGAIDGHATTTSTNYMMSLQNIDKLWVRNVTIGNSSFYHFVPEADTNVTIDGVTISDAYTISKKGTYLANTDGIDYSGSHFLIQNCTINDGDDDIVAKPGTGYCSDITIRNCVIGAGHGISIGGQTNMSLNGMTVTNCTFNGTDNGFRFKAGRGNGGLVQNVSYSNCTMNNVNYPIYFSSYYSNGSNHWPTPGPANATNAAVNSTTPFWQNITFSNITTTNTGYIGVMYGLPESPIEGIQFINCSLAGTTPFQINYAGYNGATYPIDNPAIVFLNSSINGTLLSDNSLLNNTSLFMPLPNGLYDATVVFAVPEPAGVALAAGGLAGMALRRPRNRRKQTGSPPPAPA
ncbi:MAG: glycosyl hydrolase family 28 protein [Tepidisphaeraceae bacterium]|jgi:polygalacturonase